MKIKKKVWPEYFEKILSGQKNYEARLPAHPTFSASICATSEKA